MDREQFIAELLKRLHERSDSENGFPIPRGGIQYFKEGYTSEDAGELIFIRETNLKYHKAESDVLIGDYIVLRASDDFRQFCQLECDDLFRSYQESGWDFIWKIVDANLAQAEKLQKEGIVKLLSDNDYEALKGKLFIRPINYPDHKYELKDKLYRQVGDIALVLYLLVEDTYAGGHHNVSSLKIHRLQTEQWGASENDIMDAALANTYLMAPPRIYTNPFEVVNPPYHKGAFMALGSEIKSLPSMPSPILTTTSQMNGAIAIFYPGVMERIAEMFGGSYYVAFTSIHEAHLHKKGTVTPSLILQMIRDTNNAFDPAEILSRKVYLYEQGSGQLRQMEL